MVKQHKKTGMEPEILAVALARSVWLINLNELNPAGRAVYPELLPRLRELYKFQTSPESATITAEENGLRFSEGVFQDRKGNPIAINLTIFNDGLSADSRSSTDDTDAFLDDALRHGVDEFGLVYRPDLFHSRIHVSELFFRCPFSLNLINPELAAFSEAIRIAAAKDGRDGEWETAGLTFSPDPVATPNWKAMQFKIERRVDSSFTEFRYYSFAPVSTSAHIALLKDFVRLANAG